MKKMNKALLFDLDGTLFDTSEVNYYAYKKALNEVDGDISLDYYMNNCEGKNYKVFLKSLCSEDQVEYVHKRKVVYYSQFLSEARKNTLLFEMIQAVKNNFQIGVVTTASRKNVMEILEYFGVAELFDIIITKEDVTHTKPDPEAYLKAIERLNLESSLNDVMIFEDSESGLKAAYASGVTNIVRIERF